MMKRLVTLSVAAAFAVAGASVYVPKASIRQITASPLRHAELCWIENTNQTATAYIGGKDGAQLRIADPAALRGARIRRLKLGEYAVSASSGFTYDSAKGTYTITTTATNTIIITVPPTVDVTDFGYNVRDLGMESSITPLVASMSRLERQGNTAVITFSKGNAPSAEVSDITVYAKEFGDADGYNDLTTTTFLLKDSLGQIDFANLRHWAAHLYDGNRGEDWAHYKAREAVRLDGQPLVADTSKTYVLATSASSNFVVQAGSATAISIDAHANTNDFTYTYFQVTDVDVSSTSGVVLEYAQDVVGFDVDGLAVLHADTLDGVWFTLPEGDYTITEGAGGTGTITIPAARTRLGFYKLMYHGAMSDAVRVTLRGSVVIKDALILRGTDSKYYRITVSGGSISATEVTL